MTRCYEYYCLFKHRPEKCELEVTGKKRVRSYMKFMESKGVEFSGQPHDKGLFLAAVAKWGTERVWNHSANWHQSNDLLALPSGVFNVVYADPPWEYEFSFSPRGDPKQHYQTMTHEQLLEFYEKQLKTHIAEDAVLFLWATNPKLLEALELLKAWGFEYRTNLVWIKDKIGTGYYFRGQHELLLVGHRGSLPVPAPANRVSGVLATPRRKHSEKPTELYAIIEQMYPQGSYLELFARTKRPGWQAYGDQLEA